MDKSKKFYTLKGYQMKDKGDLTTSMEDYLEMISRMFEKKETVRITDLAENLNVKPSSASKMVNNLMKAGYIDFKKYGTIVLTEKGLEEGKYLLFRHKVLHDFLCMLNGTANELEQVEKIEHFLEKQTVYNLSKLTEQMKDDV